MKPTFSQKFSARLLLMTAIVIFGLVLPFEVVFAYADLQVIAWKAPDTLSIDADLGEWNMSTPLILDRAEQLVRDANQWDGPADLSARVYFMWDQEHLYLGAEVTDDTPFMYREGFPPDMADAIVLFFSTDAAADPSRTSYDKTDFRVTLIIDDYYFNTGIDRDMVRDTGGLETRGDGGDEQVLEGYEYAVQEISGGYIYEAKISWANFANNQIAVLVPTKGMVIGFDFAMYDLDFPCPGVATVSMVWTTSGTGSENPSTWGTLIFK